MLGIVPRWYFRTTAVGLPFPSSLALNREQKREKGYQDDQRVRSQRPRDSQAHRSDRDRPSLPEQLLPAVGGARQPRSRRAHPRQPLPDHASQGRPLALVLVLEQH